MRFDSGITGDFDYADGFYLAIREFRCRGAAPREHRSCSVFSIDGVTLTGQAPLTLARRSSDLMDFVAVTAKEPGETRTVRPAALDPERMDLAE